MSFKVAFIQKILIVFSYHSRTDEPSYFPELELWNCVISKISKKSPFGYLILQCSFKPLCGTIWALFKYHNFKYRKKRIKLSFWHKYLQHFYSKGLWEWNSRSKLCVMIYIGYNLPGMDVCTIEWPMLWRITINSLHNEGTPGPRIMRFLGLGKSRIKWILHNVNIHLMLIYSTSATC